MIDINKLTINELVGSLQFILENTDNIINAQGTMPLSKAYKHYVGINYTMHLEELRKRGMNFTAEYYNEQWKQKVTK